MQQLHISPRYCILCVQSQGCLCKVCSLLVTTPCPFSKLAKDMTATDTTAVIHHQCLQDLPQSTGFKWTDQMVESFGVSNQLHIKDCCIIMYVCMKIGSLTNYVPDPTLTHQLAKHNYDGHYYWPNIQYIYTQFCRFKISGLTDVCKTLYGACNPCYGMAV